MDSTTSVLHAMTQLPHGYCYFWDPGLIWLHAISDLLIGAAYLAIPLLLYRFLKQRADVPFNWMVWCFALFIFACGATHLMGVVNIWIPSWWTSGAVKAVTAAASIPTAVLLYRLTPQLVTLPSPTQLHAANTMLAAEVAERRRIEAMLRDAQIELERRVDERTADLARANASLQLLESAVAQATDGFTITTADLDEPGPTIVFANPALSAMTEYPLEEMLGNTPRMLHGAHTDRTVLDELRSSLADTGAFAGETVNYRRDGSEFTMSWKVTPIRDDSGRVTHYLGVHRDVTAQRSLEMQFRQAQKLEAVGQLAGGIAHDFNNLLTVIGGNCSLLLSELTATDPSRQLAEEIDDASQRAERLTRQLLTFSRRQIRQPQAVSFDVVVADALRLLGRLLGHRVELRFAPTGDLGLVWADPDQLEQVVLNLAVNARDAMPRGGTLTIETRNVELGAEYAGLHFDVVPGAYVMLCVTDTGAGIPPEILQQIFEPFFTTKSEGKGTGLGLATVRGIVRQARGNMFVYSEVGVGTSFKVYLPRLHDGTRAPVASVEPTVLVRGSGVVLLVEDDTAVRSLAARILERAGYTVIQSDAPELALALARDPQQRFDILLTDVMMPGMSGPELAAAIRVVRPTMRVAYMSGYTDSSLEEREILESRAVMIAKPFTIESLTSQIARA